MSNSIYVRNHFLPQQVSKITNWHHDRNLIRGSNDKAQAKKLLEEFTEVIAALNPDMSSDYIFDEIVHMLDDLHTEGRIKPVNKEKAQSALKDALGDMTVVQINIAERNDFLLYNCLAAAWEDIKDRKGKMVEGIFVKEEDLK
jgi:hypothetical protein